MDSGSSIGVFIARDGQELRRALEESRKLGAAPCWRSISRAGEIQVAVLEDRALPSIEIIPKEGFYDYENKYQPGAALEVCPAQIPRSGSSGWGRRRWPSFGPSGCPCTPGRTLS